MLLISKKLIQFCKARYQGGIIEKWSFCQSCISKIHVWMIVSYDRQCVIDYASCAVVLRTAFLKQCKAIKMGQFSFILVSIIVKEKKTMKPTRLRAQRYLKSIWSESIAQKKIEHAISIESCFMTISFINAEMQWVVSENVQMRKILLKFGLFEHYAIGE